MRNTIFTLLITGLFLFAGALPARADKGGVVRFATLPPGAGHPEGIAADRRGNIYVATFDFTSPNVIHVFVGTSGRGGHYDLILVDDPVKDYGGMDADEQEDYFLRALVPMCKPDGQIVVTGTFVYEMDLIERLRLNKAYHVAEYPASGYGDSARFWLGNSLYGQKNYKEAITVFRGLVTASPTYPKSPEALLAVANCQIEMKDNRSARKTLDELLKAYPASEAAAAGKERLSTLKG